VSANGQFSLEYIQLVNGTRVTTLPTHGLSDSFTKNRKFYGSSYSLLFNILFPPAGLETWFCSVAKSYISAGLQYLINT
jgi:hypothetical protein